MKESCDGLVRLSRNIDLQGSKGRGEARLGLRASLRSRRRKHLGTCRGQSTSALPQSYTLLPGASAQGRSPAALPEAHEELGLGPHPGILLPGNSTKPQARGNRAGKRASGRQVTAGRGPEDGRVSEQDVGRAFHVQRGARLWCWWLHMQVSRSRKRDEQDSPQGGLTPEWGARWTQFAEESDSGAAGQATLWEDS